MYIEKSKDRLDQIDALKERLNNGQEGLDSEMSLTVGQCKEECKREALEGYDRCAYHRAVRERKKYQNLKEAGKLGAAGIAIGTIGKKLWDAYRVIT